ncbi:BZ3500_MvSof-1268-A1-R1_Chr8-1g09852 [Microbotryum saponariae]|uniref:BZ3500_MvSof-1268-A1-R1_Chr8-1g09852 protein n=1 Tax=Microbotryum saponariae TaxID=289078 RepID=A0A2X0LRM5_9BASI|nr:BZ3500_MvSof-1268-A1-R1_Chr8-1g09852 [Microbotryum saponariae]SDA08138.1 BZ3501_MvSof-1269-A2-R1_Chr8-1g09575 [Microbotryum saponariae]
MWPLLPGMTWEGQEQLSTWFGYASILAWLCAQAPQVLENHRNKSVEAIALPFLVSWFFGDFTNLIGSVLWQSALSDRGQAHTLSFDPCSCILTHQLPFQTYLATYFVMIDAMLMAQFYHYSRANPSTSIPPLSIDYPYAQTPHTHHHHHSHPHHHHRESQSSVRRSKSFHRSSSQQHSATPSRRRVKALAAEDGPELGETEGEDPMTTSWMSQSSNATTPARSLKNGRTSTSTSEVMAPRASRTSTTHSILTNPTTPQTISVSTSQVLSAPSTSTPSSGPSSPSFEIPTAMTSSLGSIASTSEARDRTMTRNLNPHHHYLHHYHHPSNLETISGSPASGSPAPLMRSLVQLEQQARDRALEMGHEGGGGEYDEEDDETERGRSAHRVNDLPSNVLPQYVRETTSRHHHSSSHHHHHQQSGSGRSSSRSRPPPSARRTSSMLFLSVGLFFTFTTLGRRAEKRVGSFAGGRARAWEVGLPKLNWVQESTVRLSKREVVITSPLTASIGEKRDNDVVMSDAFYLVDPKVTIGRNWERFIGRMSAWTCTTLYLTSRLPQIWQNFRRRSVAGLSMILFIMAFVGNSLYVISILLNPLATESVGYLLESTPYLLGSGGTLCFDITIVFQSWLYSEKRKRNTAMMRRGLSRGDSTGARGRGEEESLLGTTTDEEEGVESGRRRSSSRRIGRKRSTSSKRGWGGTSRSLDRHDPAFKMSRSVSSHRASRAPSVRTFTTDGGAEGAPTTILAESAGPRLSRAERGVLDDLDFEFDPTRSNTSSRGPSPNRSRKEHPQIGSGLPSRSRSTSRTRSRTTSDDRTSSLGVVTEAGESNLTIKG